MAAGLSWWRSLAVLVAGLALAGWGWTLPASGHGRAPGRASRLRERLAAAGALRCSCSASPPGRCSSGREPVDLGSAILAEPEVFSLRLAFAAAAFGLLYAGRPPRADAPPPRRAVGLGGRAACCSWARSLCDFPFLALPLLAAGGAAPPPSTPTAGGWGRASRWRPWRLMAILAALGHLGDGLPPRSAALGRDRAAATRSRRRRRAGAGRPRPGDPTPTSSGRDLASLVPRSPAGLERQDLAYALWRSSPLARPLLAFGAGGGAARGAAVLLLLRHAARPSGAGGLEPGALARSSACRCWEESPVHGEAPLRLGGQALGRGRASG